MNGSVFPCRCCLSELIDPSTITASILLDIFVTVFASTGNLAVLVVLWKNRSLQSNSFILLGFLSATDVLVGVFIAPWNVYRKVQWLEKGCVDYHLDRILEVPQTILVGWSLLTVSLVTADRYLALFYPFWYLEKAHKWRVVLVVSVTWSAWVILNVPYAFYYFALHSSLLHRNYYSLLVSCTFLLVLCQVSLMYARIYKLARHHSRAIAAQACGGDNAREIKMAKHLSVLVLLMLLFYTPMILLLFLIRFQFLNAARSWPLCESLTFLNSAANVLFYWWKIPCLREKIKQLCGRLG